MVMVVQLCKYSEKLLNSLTGWTLLWYVNYISLMFLKRGMVGEGVNRQVCLSSMNPFILSCWLRVRYISHGDSHCVGNWCLMGASFLVWWLIIEILDSLGPTSPISCVIFAMFHYLVLCSFVYKSRVIPAFPTSEGCCEVQMRVT